MGEKKKDISNKDEPVNNTNMNVTLESIPKEESKEDKILEEDKGSNDTGMAQTSNEQKKDNLNKKEEEPVNSKIDIAHTMINDSMKKDEIVISKEMPSQDVI